MPICNRFMKLANFSGQTHNFQKTPGGRTYNAFDFDSIMLYGEYAFSRSPNQLPTMRDKTGKYDCREIANVYVYVYVFIIIDAN